MTERAANASTSRQTALTLVHRALRWVFLVGLVGLEVELFLLKHTDGVWQVVPLVLLGGGLAVLAWYAATRSMLSARTLQGMMWLYVASGFAGTLLHFKGNVAYEKESNPGLSARELYRGAVQGSTPTLAPGAMIQLGLLGLIVVFSGNRLRDAASEATLVIQQHK
ncbi:MAG: hypothetical protein ABI852_17135 [Gemmatimonadaceae bacterium]